MNSSPNYSDARILLGRTYTWDDNYLKAVEQLNQAMERSPGYFDVYIALSDALRLMGQSDSALSVIKTGVERLPREGLLKKHFSGHFPEEAKIVLEKLKAE